MSTSTTTTKRAPRKAPAKKTAAATKATSPAPADSTEHYELVQVDPATLIVGANVRIDVRLDAEFLASIAERGVKQPILAYRNDQGHLVVKMGQRRTVAAVQGGRKTVPVVVVGEDDDVERITDQVIENDQRAGLTTGERIGAIAQLAAFGLPAAAIAKRVKVKPDDVDRAVRAAASKAATEVSATYDLTIDQAATIAEFEDDPDAVDVLTVAAQRGGFAHQAGRLRDDRRWRETEAAKKAQLEAAGFKVIAEPNYQDRTTLRLSYLLGEDHEPLDSDVKAHMACPGHAYFVDAQWGRPDELAEGDVADDGTVPDPDEVPDDDEDLDEAEEEAAERRRQPDVRIARGVPVCIDWAKHGHMLRYKHMAGGSSATRIADMAPDEREAARAERRAKLEGNKDWRAATTVRHAWLTEFLKRKTPPKGAATFIALAYARKADGLSWAAERGNTLARTLLGVPYERPAYGVTRDPDDQQREAALRNMAGDANDARATVVLLGIVLGAIESMVTDHCWQYPKSQVALYLRALESWGYELADIEVKACELAENAPAWQRDDDENTDEDTDEDETDTTPAVVTIEAAGGVL
jgi:ParB family chromosome partitioning protein